MGGVVFLGLLAAKIFAQTNFYWDLNGSTVGAGATPTGTWDTATFNWNDKSDGSTANETWVSGKNAFFSAGTDAVNAYTVTVSGTQNVGNLTVQEGTPTFTGGTLNFTGVSPVFFVTTGLTSTVSSGITGSSGFTKDGGGLLVFDTTAKTYTGTTTVTAGTLRIDTNNVTPDIALSVASGANFELNWNVTDTVGALSGAGGIDLRNNTLTTNTAANSTFSGVISDSGASGSLVKQGTGTLTLSGANTYAGTTTISGGAVTVTNSAALGASTFGNVVASGAALQLQNNVTVNEGSFTVTGTGVGGAGAINNLSGTNTLNSAVTLGGNATVGAAAGTLTISGATDLGSNTLTTTGAGNLTFSGAITNTGNVTQAGTGTLTLSGTGANSFGGALNVNSGTVVLNKTAGTNAVAGSAINIGDGVGLASSAVLRLGASNQIADYTGTITIKSDGLLDVNNQTESVNIIAGTGKIDLGTSGKFTVGVNSGSSTFAGSIANTGTFIKAGAGTFTLGNVIALSGELQLAAGTLALNGFNLTASTLHITGDTTIDFAGGSERLDVTNLIIDANVKLTILSWTNAADFFTAQSFNGATFDLTGSAPMNQIQFNGFTTGDTKWLSSDKQITPVPEPATYGAILLSLMTGTAMIRRRRAAARH